MTPGQWQEVTAEVDSVWGRSSKWSQADRVYPRIMSIDYTAAMSALQDLFLAGTSHAPSTSELAAKARTYQGVTEIDRADCDHPDWAIVAVVGDVEVGVCRVCRVEAEFPKGLLKTPAERGVRQELEVPV